MSKPYTLYHGDCLDILSTLPEQSLHAIICDPPYGTTACKWDSVIPFDPMWRELKRLIKPRGAIVLFGSQPFTSALVMSNPKWFRYEWVWNKVHGSNFAVSRFQPLREHESILVFSVARHTYNPIPEERKGAGLARLEHGYKSNTSAGQMTTMITTNRKGKVYDTLRLPGSIQTFSNRTIEERGLHPTQKPLALLEYLVKTYTNEGDTVLDFTMGSGTTGHACGNLGRRFIGIEQDRGYYEIAAERIATAYEPLRAMQVAI